MYPWHVPAKGHIPPTPINWPLPVKFDCGIGSQFLESTDNDVMCKTLHVCPVYLTSFANWYAYLSRHSHLLYFHRSQVEMPSLIARHISMWKAPFPFLPNLNHTWSLLMHSTEFFSASPSVYPSLPFLSNTTSMIIPQRSIRGNDREQPLQQNITFIFYI